MWWKKSDDEMAKIKVASQVISSHNQSVDQVEDEIFHLLAENRTLKKSLSEVSWSDSFDFILPGLVSATILP